MESAFTSQNCTRRLLAAKERFDTVCRFLGDMADDFLQYESIGGEPWDQIVQMHAKLPEALLARALAKEGLELIEQVQWEAYICKHNPETSLNRDQLKVHTTIAETMQAEGPGLEQTRHQMNTLIESAMDAEKRLTDIAAALKRGLNPESQP